MLCLGFRVCYYSPGPVSGVGFKVEGLGDQTMEPPRKGLSTTLGNLEDYGEALFCFF